MHISEQTKAVVIAILEGKPVEWRWAVNQGEAPGEWVDLSWQQAPLMIEQVLRSDREHRVKPEGIHKYMYITRSSTFYEYKDVGVSYAYSTLKLARNDARCENDVLCVLCILHIEFDPETGKVRKMEELSVEAFDEEIAQ